MINLKTLMFLSVYCGISSVSFKVYIKSLEQKGAGSFHAIHRLIGVWCLLLLHFAHLHFKPKREDYLSIYSFASKTVVAIRCPESLVLFLVFIQTVKRNSLFDAELQRKRYHSNRLDASHLTEWWATITAITTNNDVSLLYMTTKQWHVGRQIYSVFASAAIIAIRSSIIKTKCAHTQNPSGNLKIHDCKTISYTMCWEKGKILECWMYNVSH